MNSLRKFCAAAALALTFSLPVCAGDISTGPGVAPPPPPNTLTTPGEIHIPPALGGAAEGGEAAAVDLITEITLALLGSVLTLF